jgi:general secretion pathway protein D
VIIASQSDYRNLVRVIEKLDIPRRQVFVEAVIMEVNIDRTSEFGVQLHQEIGINSDQGKLPVLFGTKYSKQGAPPSFSLANLLNFGGFLAGIQGPNVPELQKLGISIPQFGVVLHALQQSSDVNVLSTPHILTSDNEEAEITVGQNVPFQAGFSPANLNLGTGLGTGTPGTTGTTGVPGLGGVNPFVGSFGLGSFFAPITRQNVELKLTIKPQINESDFIRMVISEQTEEIASSDPVLGPTTSKRTAKTTVVAKDQETVVLGGIMQDRTIESVSKTPILGDIPILGHLFREQSRHKVKTNLLLFLTPYIIKDKSDFRRIFERKLQERQQFVEEFYGQIPGYDVAIDFSRKAGPIAKLGQKVQHEEMRLENGGPGLPGERILRPRGDVGGELPPPRRRVLEEPPPEPAPAPIYPAPAPAPAPPPEPGTEATSPSDVTPAPGPAVIPPDLSEPPGSSLTAPPPAPPPTPNPPDQIRVRPIPPDER